MALPLGRLEGSESFAHLYATYRPRVAGLARRFLAGTGAAHAVDDVVQETFLRAYRSDLHLEDGEDPWPWLATVARNLCHDARRRRDVVAAPALPVEELAASAPGPDVAVEHRARATYVADALDALPARQRQLLLLRHVEDVPCAEIARAERTTVDAVKSALGRARSAFRARYEGWRGLVPGILGQLGARVSALRDTVARLGSTPAPALRPGIVAGFVAAVLALGFAASSTTASEPDGSPPSAAPRVGSGPRAVIEQAIDGDASASPIPAGGRLISFQPPESPDVPPTPALPPVGDDPAVVSAEDPPLGPVGSDVSSDLGGALADLESTLPDDGVVALALDSGDDLLPGLTDIADSLGVHGL